METKIIYRKPLGNAGRKYRQDRLVISTFQAYTEHVRHGIELCRELGFTMVEFGWVNPENARKCMTACEETGLDGVFQNWEALGGAFESQGSRELDFNKLFPYLEYTKKYKHVAGYYVWDEPWEKETMKSIGKLVDQMEQLEPEKLQYTVALPSYNSSWTWENGLYEDYLTSYAEMVNPQVLSLDYYPFQPDNMEPVDQLDSSNLFLDLALLRKLSQEKEIPMWFYFQAQDDPGTGTYVSLCPEKVRMQQYNALLHGAKGLQNYNVVEGALNRDGSRGPLFFATKELNRCCEQLGKTFMALTSVGVFHSPEVLADKTAFDAYRQPVRDSGVLGMDELPFRCSVGEFTDEQENRYLFIQNRDYYDARRFELALKKKFRVYQVSKEDGMQSVKEDSCESLRLKLKPGDAVLFRFQDAEEPAYLIDYVLRK